MFIAWLHKLQYIISLKQVTNTMPWWTPPVEWTFRFYLPLLLCHLSHFRPQLNKIQFKQAAHQQVTQIKSWRQFLQATEPTLARDIEIQAFSVWCWWHPSWIHGTGATLPFLPCGSLEMCFDLGATVWRPEERDGPLMSWTCHAACCGIHRYRHRSQIPAL